MWHQLVDDIPVGLITEFAVEFERAHAGDRNDGRNDEQADHRGGIDALLRFADGGRGQGALGDRLVGTPVVELAENHARQQGLPGQERIFAADHRQPFGRDPAEIPVHGVERENGDQHGHAKDDHPVVSVAKGDRAQAAQNGVAGADGRGHARDGHERDRQPEHRFDQQ